MAEEVLFAPLLTQQTPLKSREILHKRAVTSVFSQTCLHRWRIRQLLSVYFYANVGFESRNADSRERQIVLLPTCQGKQMCL